MKKLLIISTFILMVFSFTFAQTSVEEINKARQIKLLEDDWEDVKRIFGDKTLDFWEFSSSSRIITKDTSISFFYSSGQCFEKDALYNSPEKWNVEKGKVKKIQIVLKTHIELEDAGIDYSKFFKERWWVNKKKTYVYSDKNSGIGIYTDRGWIEGVHLIPPKKNYPQLCDDKDEKKYNLSKSWFDNWELKYRVADFINNWANVTDLTLNRTEITTDSDSDAKIKINVSAKDDENDRLEYRYTVSGGKIIGQGAEVIWDLSGEKAGTYTIKAGVDDGCGICGKWMTKTIVVN